MINVCSASDKVHNTGLCPDLDQNAKYGTQISTFSIRSTVLCVMHIHEGCILTMRTNKQIKETWILEKMSFLLQKNLLDFEAEDKSKDIENVLKEIRGTAKDGLSFLKVLQLLIEIVFRCQIPSCKDAMGGLKANVHFGR